MIRLNQMIIIRRDQQNTIYLFLIEEIVQCSTNDILCEDRNNECLMKKKILTRFFQLILSFNEVCTINNIKRVPYSGKRWRNSLIILGWTTGWWGIGSSSFPFFLSLDFSLGLKKNYLQNEQNSINQRTVSVGENEEILLHMTWE